MRSVFGGGSIKLLRVFGIRIGVDPSWFIVLFLIIWSLSGSYKDALPGRAGLAFTLAVASALLFFLSILLHELGHAWVAIRNGIGISGIDLWMFGGLAKMTRDTDSPGVEFKVAAAGPAVTLVIALACYGAAVVISGSDEAWRAVQFDIGPSTPPAVAVLGYLAFINAVLLVFNLIPGYPLDGGRIARSIAWWRTGDRSKATRFAALLGRIFGYLLIGLGLFWFFNGNFIGGIWFGFIGFFLHQAARSAEAQTEFADRIEGLRVSDLMDADPVSVPAELKLDRVLEDYFVRYGWEWFPVVDSSGRFLGLVTRDKVEGVPEALRPGWTVDQVAMLDAASAFRVQIDEPLETVLGSEGLQRLGALMAVDANGVLRGVVTLDRVRRAVQPQAPAGPV